MKGLVVVLLLSLAAAGAHAEASDAVASARRSYEELRYDEASALLEAALADARLSREARVAALELKGIVDVIRGDEEEARASFRALLVASPDATLPAGLSPKITHVFDEVRASMPAPGPEPVSADVTANADGAEPAVSTAPEESARLSASEPPVATSRTEPEPALPEDEGLSPVAVGVAAGAAVGAALLVVGAGSLLLFARSPPPESSLGTLQLP